MITSSLIIGTNEHEYEPEKFNYNSNNVFELLDKSKKPLFWAQLDYNNNIFYIETDYLTVLDFNPEMKYIKVELDEKTQNFFDRIDDRGTELLKNLLTDEEYSDLFDEFEPKLDYSTLIRLDSTTNKFYFKIRLDDKIKINLNKKKISITDLCLHKFSSNDKIRFLLQINSLNLYKNDYKCGIKYFCHNIEVNTPIDVSQFKRPINDNYKFTPSKIYQPIAEDLECDYGATEVSPKEQYVNNQENNEENIKNDEDNNNENITQTTTDNIFISTSNKKKIKPRAPPKSKITTETIITTTTKPTPKKKAPVKNK
jgi:hypothetical protein